MAGKTNYPKQYGYKYQRQYDKEHYAHCMVRIPIAKKSVLDSIAQARGVSLNQLIKDAIFQTYGIDCSAQK